MVSSIPRVVQAGSLLCVLSSTVEAFQSAVWPTAPAFVQDRASRTNPFKSGGLEIEMPNLDALFQKIQDVSPLARSVISHRNHPACYRGFDMLQDQASESLKWKTVEANPRKTVHSVEKIDRFEGKDVPLLRFRSTLNGPCSGEYFGKLILDIKERKKWDTQVEQIYELYPVRDLDSANIAMGFGRYGDCARLGVGYGQTKAGLGISPREQLFLYGLQDFNDGSSIIWGTEMQPAYSHLLPLGPRHTRSISHLFAATLTPTGRSSFDVEYVLQLEVGGKIPSFLTTPVVIDTVKNLFRTAGHEFSRHGTGGALDNFLEEKASQDSLGSRVSLLMSP